MNCGLSPLPRYLLPPEIAPSRSRPTTRPGRRAQGHGDHGGRLRPPTLTDDPGLDILEGTDSNGKARYENRPEEESFNRDGTKKPIKRWAYDPRSRTDWRNTTAERTYPTYDWSRASGRAGGRDREFWRCVYKKRCSHEWKDWCAAKGKGPSVITPMSCRPEPLGWAQYEPQERKPHQCNRRVDCMDVAGVLLYTTSCLAAVFYVLGTPLLVNYLIQLTRAQLYECEWWTNYETPGGASTSFAWNVSPGPSSKLC